MHGTREIPAFVATLASAAARRSPVVVALEMPRDGTPSLDAFLDGDGSAAAREKLVHDTWWQDRYQDGRRSVAMLDLLESIRALRASGAKIDVLRFDIDQGAKTSPGERDERMASTLLAARKAQPDAVFVVFAGNLHVARKGFPFQPGFTWMAMHLAKAGVRFVSLNARYVEGSAWGCSGSTPEGCGPRYLDSMHTSAAGIHLEPSADGNYDGWFGVGAATASPPAGLPALAAGLAEKLAHLRESPSGETPAPISRMGRGWPIPSPSWSCVISPPTPVTPAGCRSRPS